MKNLIKLFGIIALVAIFGLSFTACSDGGGGDSGPQVPAFSVSGQFSKRGGAGSGDVKFDLKSDKAQSRNARSAADNHSINGVLEDGAITIKLSGSYDPAKGTWSVSANSSMIIYTLDGAVDTSGNSLGSTATIAVKSGDNWTPFVFPITEQAVEITNAATAQDSASGGAPAFGRGLWKTKGSQYGYSWDVSVLISQWKIKASMKQSDPSGNSSMDEMDMTILEVSGSGAGPLTVIYTYVDYEMTNTNLAKAISQCIFGNQTNVTALTDDQAMGLQMGGFNPNTSPDANIKAGRYIYYDGFNSTYWGYGFSSTQMDKFHGTNYWKSWASSNSVTTQNYYAAIKVTYQNASNPSYFDMVNMVKVMGNQWEYQYEFNTLAALKAATLIEEREWEWPMSGLGNPTDKGVSKQRLTR